MNGNELWPAFYGAWICACVCTYIPALLCDYIQPAKRPCIQGDSYNCNKLQNFVSFSFSFFAYFYFSFLKKMNRVYMYT